MSGEPMATATAVDDAVVAELVEQLRAAEELIEVLSDRAASYAHDLRNLLSSIGSMVELELRSDVDRADLKGLVDSAQAAGRLSARMRSLADPFPYWPLVGPGPQQCAIDPVLAAALDTLAASCSIPIVMDANAASVVAGLNADELQAALERSVAYLISRGASEIRIDPRVVPAVSQSPRVGLQRLRLRLSAELDAATPDAPRGETDHRVWTGPVEDALALCGAAITEERTSNQIVVTFWIPIVPDPERHPGAPMVRRRRPDRDRV